MHARELVEVAGIVASRGPLLVAGAQLPRATYVEQYWSATKGRFESWSFALKACSTAACDGSRRNREIQSRAAATIHEIFASEILTRVWTAVLVACDRKLGGGQMEPLARNALATHLEARHRAMAILVDGRGLSTEQAVHVNRVRRRAERYSDVLIGGLLRLGDIGEFAFDRHRAEDFALDLNHRQRSPGGRHAWRLTLVSLHNAFLNYAAQAPANPDSNSRIAASILASFPPDLFDSTGLFRSLWMMRLSAGTSDAQGLIDDLLGSTAPSRPAAVRPRHRRI